MVWKKKNKKISGFSHEIASCFPYMEQKGKFFRNWKQNAISIPYMEWKRKKSIFFISNLANSTLLSLYGVKGRKSSGFCQNALLHLY